MNLRKIEQFLSEYQASASFIIIAVIVIFFLTQNAYLASHLEECRSQNELYKQNPPRLVPGEGGYDNWKSSIEAIE